MGPDVPDGDIGTLPTYYLGPKFWADEDQSFGVGANDLAGSQPMGLVLTGAPMDVADLVVSAKGPKGGGMAVYKALSNGMVEASFYGDVVVELDPVALSAGMVQISLMIGPFFEGGAGAVTWNGQTTKAVTLNAMGTFDLPYAKILAADMLSVGGVSFILTDGGGRRANKGSLTFLSAGDTLKIVQNAP